MRYKDSKALPVWIHVKEIYISAFIVNSKKGAYNRETIEEKQTSEQFQVHA